MTEAWLLRATIFGMLLIITSQRIRIGRLERKLLWATMKNHPPYPLFGAGSTMNHAVRKLAESFHAVGEREKIFRWPIRAMQARGWIMDTNNTADLKSELARFFGCADLDCTHDHLFIMPDLKKRDL